MSQPITVKTRCFGSTEYVLRDQQHSYDDLLELFDDEQNVVRPLVLRCMEYEADIKRALDALDAAAHELNEIRARDGVPRCHDGRKSDVDEEYFSSVVEQCFAAIRLLRGSV